MLCAICLHPSDALLVAAHMQRNRMSGKFGWHVAEYLMTAMQALISDSCVKLNFHVNCRLNCWHSSDGAPLQIVTLFSLLWLFANQLTQCRCQNCSKIPHPTLVCVNRQSRSVLAKKPANVCKLAVSPYMFGKLPLKVALSFFRIGLHIVCNG